jgi:hypothetical protein
MPPETVKTETEANIKPSEPAKTEPPKPQGKYKPVANFREPAAGGDIVANITQRSFGSLIRYSFELHREFETPSGDQARTPWFDARHMNEVRAMLDKIEERLKKEEAKQR